MNQQAIPGITDAENLYCLSPRLGIQILDDDLLDVIAESDEAVAVMDHEDEEKLQQEAKRQRSQRESQSRFVEAWSAHKRLLVRQAAAKAAPKAKGKAKAAPVAPKRRLPLNLRTMEETAAVKPFMPPYGDLWKSRSDRSWHSCVPPFSSCNRSVSLHGDRAALIVVSDAWYNWCRLEGVPFDQCPMQGLVPLSEI